MGDYHVRFCRAVVWVTEQSTLTYTFSSSKFSGSVKITEFLSDFVQGSPTFNWGPGD